MIFGVISKQYLTPLIALTGSIDSNWYFDECINRFGLIIAMNEAYSPFEWKLMPDGATPHTSRSSMDYLRNYCNILDGWPSNSPNHNPIENL